MRARPSITVITVITVVLAAPVLGLIVATPAPAHAAASTDVLPPDPIRAQYVDAALRGNLALRQQRLNVEDARAQLDQARAQLLPSVTLEARASERYGAVLDLGGLVNPAYAGLNQLMGRAVYPTDVHVALPLERETKIVASQPLFVPALVHLYQLRGDQDAAQRAQWRVFARDLRAEVQAAYFQYGRALEVAGLLEKTSALLEENLRVSALLVKSGKLTEDAVLRARAELGELTQQRAEADDGVDRCRRYLNFLANRALDAAAPTPSPVAAGQALPLSAATADETVQARDELIALAAGQRAAVHARAMARDAFLPTLAVAGEYGFQGDRYDFSLDKDYLVLSLVLRWNLWNGLGDAAKVRQADLGTQRLALQEQEVRRQIALQIHGAWRAAETARRAVSTVNERAVSSRASYALVSRRYAVGAAPPVELLEARTALTRVEVEEVSSRYALALKLVELERVASAASEFAP